MVGKFDKIWGGNETLYQQVDTKIVHWNTKVPNVGLVNHVEGVYPTWVVLFPLGAPKRNLQLLLSVSLETLMFCLLALK